MDPITIVVVAIAVAAAGTIAFFRFRGSSEKQLPPDVARAGGTTSTARKPPRSSLDSEDGERVEAPPEPAADPNTADEDLSAAPVAPPSQRPSEFGALKRGLKTTRSGFISRLAELFGSRKEIDPELLEEVEQVLITADLGVRTTSRILDNLRGKLASNELSDEAQVWTAIRGEAASILGTQAHALDLSRSPAVILVVGVNGVGKTTTIGKLASRLQTEGKKVVLAAGDTFRAAAVLQLEVWGRKVGCTVVKGKERADPGSVIFEAVKQGQAEGADVIIADTAGRLHTKVPLMDELKKVHRTAQKAIGDRDPDEVLLVLDSTTGQNAIQQAELFRDALPITGIVLTKLDGTAKGGVILGIVDEHRVPVKFIGIGERVEDLRVFHPEPFIEALFAKPDDESAAA